MRIAIPAALCLSAALGLLVPDPATAQPDAPPDTTTYRLTGTRIAFAQDIRIERDEEVTDAAIVIGGDLTVDGRVRDGIVVVGGDLHLASTADVRGDVVLVGGQLTRDAGENAPAPLVAAYPRRAKQRKAAWRICLRRSSGAR